MSEYRVLRILICIFFLLSFQFKLDTAFGKNRYDEKWYYFDDSCVTSSEESSVCTNAAYLLVYLRQDKKKELSIEKMDY